MSSTCGTWLQRGVTSEQRIAIKQDSQLQITKVNCWFVQLQGAEPPQQKPLGDAAGRNAPI